ncbi:Kdo hydroxylase family protein [Klebsiella pneumoniae]
MFTDQVSHAALAGQFCLEQTFLLPVTAQQFPEKSPLRILEQQFQKPLV